jgi:hypothetical protein
MLRPFPGVQGSCFIHKYTIDEVSKATGWSVHLLQALINDRISHISLPTSLATELRERTTLLPPQVLNPLNYVQLKKMVPVTNRLEVPKEKLEALARLRALSKPLFHDDEINEVWGVRSPADLPIRRSRMRDTYEAYRAGDILNEFWIVATRLLNFDIIATVNILNANFLASGDGFDWFGFWDGLGAFQSDLEHFTTVTKFVDDILRKRGWVDVPIARILQCSCLSGYRNLPYGGFDPIAETHRLAHGGEDHGFGDCDNQAMFRAIARENLLKVRPHRVDWVSLEDYVLSGEWETGGSSSIGRVEWEAYDSKGHFKARKNLVPDVVDLQWLAHRTQICDRQVNVTLLKNELGKVRLAVASNIEIYLKMSWVGRYLGHCYKQWPGSTIDETAAEAFSRSSEMLDAVLHSFNLPYDFEQFDHQPTTRELKDLVLILFALARYNVPSEHLEEFEQACGAILASFDHATLTLRVSGWDEITDVMTGGLGSGLFWTSVLGNAWNTVIRQWALKVMKDMNVCTTFVRGWIRGDDSAIVAPTYAKTLLLKVCMDALGAKGNESKFGILRGRSEFLRQMYDRDGIWGYPMRVLPGLGQRKPWSSQAWDDETVMGQLFDVCNMMKRRQMNPVRVDLWWKAAVRVWTQRKHVSASWLGIPRALGGLGILPWDGRSLPTVKWPRVAKDQVRVANATEWRSNWFHAKYARFSLSYPEAGILAVQARSAKIVADDVPSVSSVLRAEANGMAKPKLVRISKPGLPHKYVSRAYEAVLSLKQFQVLGSKYECRRLFTVPGRGCWAKDTELWRQCCAVARIRGGSALTLMEEYNRDFVRDVRKWERLGLSRTSAIGWVLGESLSVQSSTAHPVLSYAVDCAVAWVMFSLMCSHVSRSQWYYLLSKAQSVMEESLARSRLSQRYLRW